MMADVPRRRRGRKALLVIVALATGGALTVVLLSRGGSSQATDNTATALPPNTVKVIRQTLKDTETADGELGYGTTTTATSRTAGTITWLPDSGQTITRGQPLYQADNRPTTLLYGTLPAYRRLKVGSEGADVKQLEQNLNALGYDGFAVDDEYTSATADAVEDWQGDRGLEQTGIVELNQIVFAPAAVRVDSLQAAISDPVKPDQKLLAYTGISRAITVELDASDQRLARLNATVSITLPDDSVVIGRVTEVSTVIEPAASPGQDPQTKIEVIVSLGSQKAVATYGLASVDVTFLAAERKNVLTVPVAALLALQEGGFGVEVTDGSMSHYLPVKTGMFASGRVEISGKGITAGISVGVPK
jgi:peptidoglycan hydrolase-like protein with peptidoglycan-binding domain